MKDKLELTVWLTHPADVANLDDPEAPLSFNHAPREYEMDKQGWIKVADVDLYFDRPRSKDVVAKAVEVLKAKIQEVNLEAAEKNAALHAAIEKLLSLTYEER